MKKGIVLEVHDDYVTMLTPDGEFLKSRKQKGQVDIGEEIIFFPLHKGAAEKKRLAAIFKMKWAIVTMLTAAVLFFSFYPKYVNNQVYAYVSLDVNPSMELGLNKNMQVVSIDAFNDEAKLLLPLLGDWKNEDLSKVSSDIMDLIRQKGYLKSGGEIIIASVLADGENLVWKKKMQNEISSFSKNIQVENVSITTIETTSEKRDEAIKHGVSPGTYVQNERKTELVDSEDTSKAAEELQIAPSKVEAEQLKVNTEPEKPGHTLEVPNTDMKDAEGKQERKHLHEETKDQRKEDRNIGKEEKKEYREQVKEDKREQREERKQEREERREERKEERHQHKEDRKNDRGQNKQDHHDSEKERH
ncbi:anti-sigma factor domain-containing protein [Bacillus tianshenii]|uniref:anti-sigma factor domain-containing protein n=1 Tax=Sutcliffiella tianshenii TaxID=1463404 RepID=UPI001CD1B4BA|nr:anti-sigma factor domain-containing protein [Bacillus tianshenii]MCA1319278.1 anti-sigma factor domain-containing protein [Bacillus tianshenii]